jgi:hypothetical protein
LSEKTPDFEVQVAIFQQFLRANQYSDKIVWILPQDLLLTGKRLFYARIPVSKLRDVVARQTFEKGIAQGRGVLLGTLFELQGTSFCYVWVPANDDEAARSLMPTGVKLSIRTDRISVTTVRSLLLWWCLKIRFRQKQALKKELFR